MMNVQQFKQLTLSEQVILIPLKGRFIAQRQNASHQAKLYYWHDHFLEIHYKWPVNRGMGANWEPFTVSAFPDDVSCLEKLTPYVEQLSLRDLPI